MEKGWAGEGIILWGVKIKGRNANLKVENEKCLEMEPLQ